MVEGFMEVKKLFAGVAQRFPKGAWSGRDIHAMRFTRE
jgi:hypothetical protein